MKTLGKICTENKLLPASVLSYMRRTYGQQFSLNSKVDPGIEDAITNCFSKSAKSQAINQPSNKNNKQSGNRIIQIFSENRFVEPVQEVVHPKYHPITSHFSDADAQKICSRMANGRIRYFSNLFNSKDEHIDHETLKYQIHHLANKALQFYGGEILTFIINLKTWSFKGNNVELFKANKNSVYDFDANFSSFELHSTSGNEVYRIEFKRANDRNPSDNSSIRISSSRTNRRYFVNIKGQLITNFHDIDVEIALFRETVNGSFHFYSGYDDDYCDICGRPLTDALSVKYGRGPHCRRDYGLKW